MKNIEPIVFIIICLLYIVAGGYCVILPKRAKRWVDKRSQLEFRFLGILISLTGALLIMQLLAFSAVFKLLVYLMETIK